MSIKSVFHKFSSQLLFVCMSIKTNLSNNVSFALRLVFGAILRVKSIDFCFWSDSCFEKFDKFVLLLN